jgi:hypothetical protein
MAGCGPGRGNSITVGPEIRWAESRNHELFLGGGRPIQQADGDHFFAHPQISLPPCSRGPEGDDRSGQHQAPVGKGSRDHPLRVNSGHRIPGWHEA